MNLNRFDWLIVATFLCGLAALALYVRRYTRSVSDFLAGNRAAGRYLLTLSEGLTTLGLTGTIANFEKFYKAGFASSWWGMMLLPIGMVVALSGWIGYRYRETRAMTMAQFFEMRYSRRFRIFAGILGWISGVLNYGIFPGIAAHFLVHFCGLPESFRIAGLSISTYPTVMLFMLSTTIILTLSGGMVTVMICDFVQAQFINVVFLLVMVVLFRQFSWADMTATLEAVPKGHSLLNPFDQANISDFDVWFFLILGFKLVYNKLGWQGTQGYNCSAKSPHEAKMAGILAEWRGGVSGLIIMLMPICAYVLLHNAHYADTAASIQAKLAAIHPDDERTRMIVPLALLRMLPAGMIGLLCAALMAATIGNDTTYLHSWGSMFVQDIILPLRGQPLSPRHHLTLLRLSILGVAVFSFFWSLYFPLRQYIYMYFLVTGAVYLAGSGAVIIGGLYWSRGTTAAAWAAMITGAALSVAGVTLNVIWPQIPALRRLAPQFPLNGAWMALIASLAATAVYLAVSLLGCRRPFDMDHLLNRGEKAIGGPHPAAAHPSTTWKRLGITAEFTRGDKIIYLLKIVWTGFWIVTFLAGTAWGLIFGISDHLWSNWWLFTVILGAAVGVITVVWFLWGGTKDMFDLLKTLKSAHRDAHDDGRVPPNPGEKFPRLSRKP